MRKYYIAFSIILFIFCILYVVFADVFCLKTFTFDEDKALDQWKSMVLNGKVDYQLMKDGEEGYVDAVSKKACSALYYRIGYKLTEYPYLRWKWRIVQFPDKSNVVTEEQKNDYAARVYVIFPSLTFSLSKFIEYVWDESLPVGTVFNNPKGENIKIIVVQKGKEAENDGWAVNTRNVYEDYINVFGEKPGSKVGAIAIMCDADNTETNAESLFDDITIEKIL